MIKNINLIATTTAWERLRETPPHIWFKLVVIIVLIIAFCILVKSYQKLKSNLVIVFILLLATFISFSNWIYSRGEPKMLTPLIDSLVKIAPFVTNKAVNKDQKK